MLPADRPTLLTSKQALTLTAEKEPQAEEKSDSEEEEKGPSQDYICCGVDLKPFLPVTLAVSTVIGGMCVLFSQFPMICGGLTSMSHSFLVWVCFVVYGVTLSCMTYAACADPGQLKAEKKSRNVEVGADIERGMPSIPLRAQHSFQYDRPIRRYDHFCKWLNNAIGLLNHREFILTVGGLMCIAVLGCLDTLHDALLCDDQKSKTHIHHHGIVVDMCLAFFVITKKGVVESVQTEIILGSHLAYSLILLKLVCAVLKIHVGLISRNEMGKEWKNHWHYVANATSMGDNVYVHHLDDDEFNDLLDSGSFIYDPARNPFDKGCLVNCCTFWCQARWTADAKGEL